MLEAGSWKLEAWLTALAGEVEYKGTATNPGTYLRVRLYLPPKY